MKLHACKKCGIPIWKGKYCYVCLSKNTAINLYKKGKRGVLTIK